MSLNHLTNSRDPHSEPEDAVAAAMARLPSGCLADSGQDSFCFAAVLSQLACDTMSQRSMLREGPCAELTGESRTPRRLHCVSSRSVDKRRMATWLADS